MVSISNSFYIILIISLIISCAFNFDNGWRMGAIFIGLNPIICYFCLSKKGKAYFDAFSPLWIFPSVLGLVYGFGALEFMNENPIYVARLVGFPFVGLLFYYCFMLFVVTQTIKEESHIKVASNNLDISRILFWILLLIASVAALIMVIKVGMPFLYEDKLDDRLNARAIVSSNIIYLIRISFIGFYIYLASIFHSNSNLLKIEKLWIILIFSYITFINIIPGWRGPIFIFLFNSLAIYHYKYKKLNMKKTVGYGILFMVLLLGWGFARIYFQPGGSFWIYHAQKYSDSIFVVFLYWSVYQFSVYSLGFLTILKLFLNGGYLFGGVFGLTLATLAPGKQETLGEIIKNKAGFTFAGAGLNPTIMGDAYADGGLLGIMIYMSTIGIIMGITFSKMKANPSVFNVVLYSYLTTCIVLGTMTGLLSQASYAFHLLVLLSSFGFIEISKSIKRR